MKICFCNNRFPPKVVGGAELIAYDLARQLRDLGHQVCILTLSDSRVSEPYVVDDLDVDSMPNTNFYNQFSHQKRGGLIKGMFGALDTLNPVAFFHALRHLRNCQFSVLCTHNLKGMGPAVWLAARVLRIPIVHVIHDYWLVCPTSIMFKNGRTCDRPCIACQRVSRPKAWLSGAVSHVVGVSKFVLDQHLQQDFFPRAQCSVIHNARAAMGVGPSMPAKPHSPFRVGFIGRIEATKGIRECFASVAAANTTDVELHIAGRDNNGVLGELIRTHAQLKVVVHGFANPRDFYNFVDVILVTSMWNEPFGTVSFEPWEFYKPSIAFAVGGLPEVYEGLPELTVPPGDVAAIGALIRRFMNDHDFYKEMAQRCQARREYFLPQRQAREFERVLLAARARYDKRGTVRSDA
jgi:glycogen(starch) synthase